MASKIDTTFTYTGLVASGLVVVMGVTNATSAMGLDQMGLSSGVAVGVGGAGVALFTGLSMVQ